MLMLPQVNRALLRMDETTEHLEWKLCGSAVSNLNKRVRNAHKIIYQYMLYQFVCFHFLTVYSCFAFK
jgi:hypothetical protein